jgi:SAM-dependent methyltransferase
MLSSMAADNDPYRDPALYDLEYGDQHDDVAWYVGLARRHRGPVLELGCGNGRITLALARADVEVHGIDASPVMLADLERKLRAEPDRVRLRVRVREGNFLTLEGSTQHPLVVLPFNALHHCPGHAALRSLLDGVRRSLRPGGVFALDCYLPDPVLYRRDPDRLYEERRFPDPRGGELLSWERGWWSPRDRVHHVCYVYRRADGTEEELHLRLHMYGLAELRELVHRAGFAIAWEASDFDGAPMFDGALKWVVALRLA